jgi:hypothetical protein
MKIDSKEGLIAVSRTHLGKTDTVKEERIRVRPYLTETATVAVKFSKKIQVVQYEPIGFEILVSCPCYKEEIKEVYLELKELVGELMAEQLEEITGNHV